MRKSFFIFMMLLSLACHSQKQGKHLIDSLILELPKMKPDTVKAFALSKVSYTFASIDPKKGQQFGSEALKLSTKLKCNDGIAAAFGAMGKNYSAISEDDKAIAQFEKGMAKTSNPKIFGVLLKDISMIYFGQANYAKSLGLAHRALKIAEESHNLDLKAAVLSNIGLVYFDLENYAKAIAHFQMALDINEAIGNKVNMAKNLSNLGNAYSISGNDNKAIGYYKRSVKITSAFGNKAGTGTSIGAIGNSYFRLEEFKKALPYCIESMKIADEIGNKILVAFNYGLLGDIYFQMAKTEMNKAKQQLLLANGETNFQKALEIHKQYNSRKEIMYDYQNLSAIEKMTGDYKAALKSTEMESLYKDSIFNADNKETIKNLEDKRTIELRDKQILLNKLTLEAKEKQKLLYILGIGLLLIVVGFVYKQSQNRKKNNEKLQVLNTELDNANKVKARFFSILNHDLRSPVSNLIHFLHLQKESPELFDAESKQRMENKTIAGAENLLTSMEDILLWSKGQMENFEPQPKNIVVSNLFEDTKNHFASEENVKITFENPNDIQIYTDENYLKTIIRNLTGNAIKALPQTVIQSAFEGQIIWKAWRDNKQTFLSISDNGKGATDEQFKALYDENEVVGIKSGLGLHLIRDLAKAIGCEISVESKARIGTIFTLKFS